MNRITHYDRSTGDILIDRSDRLKLDLWRHDEMGDDEPAGVEVAYELQGSFRLADADGPALLAAILREFSVTKGGGNERHA